VRQVCRAYGVPFRQIGNPNDTTYIRGLSDRRPDLLVSVACPHILKAPVLRVAPMGCINIHHAPLPRYKGMMPTFWQLYHGEPQVGITVHYVNQKIDEGEPVLQETIPVEPGESLDHLIRRSKQLGAHYLARVLRNLPLPRRTVALAAGEGSYFTFPTPQEIRDFHRKGLRAI
jgi:methionyl-tRNA formyltransferase